MLQRCRHLATILLLCAAALPGRAALAADGDVERTLTVVELRSGREPNSLTLDYLKEVLAGLREDASGNLILVPGEKTAEKLGRTVDQVPGALTDERRTALAEAKAKGIQYLDNADADNAIKSLQRAEALYRAALAAPGADDSVRREYLDVLAQLATAYVVKKDLDAARDVFRTVVTTFGLKAAITDDFYRPDVVELFKTTVKDVQKQPKGAVEVTSTPPGARIILGGGDRGTTPGTVTDLIPGVYALRLQHGSTTSLLHRVKVEGGQTVKANIDVAYESHLLIEERSVGLSYADFDMAKARIDNDAAVLGRDLGVNLVLAVGVLDEKLVSFLVDVGERQTVRSSAVKVPGVGISKRAVNRVLVTVFGEKGEGPDAPAASPWYTSVPGLATGGAALVSLGVGLAFSGNFAAKTFYPCQDVEVNGGVCGPQFKDKADAAADDYKTNQTIAGVGLGLGGVLAITSGVLFYLHSQKNAPLDAAGLPVPGPGRDDVLPPTGFGLTPVTFATAAAPAR